MSVTPEQAKEIIVQLLPAVAPLLIELLKKLIPRIMEKVPWFLKPIVSAIAGALIGLLTESIGGEAGNGAVAGLTGSIGYLLAREKPPKGSGGIRGKFA